MKQNFQSRCGMVFWILIVLLLFIIGIFIPKFYNYLMEKIITVVLKIQKEKN